MLSPFTLKPFDCVVGLGKTKANLAAFAKVAQDTYKEVKPDTIQNIFKTWDLRTELIKANNGGPCNM